MDTPQTTLQLTHEGQTYTLRVADINNLRVPEICAKMVEHGLLDQIPKQ